jgi:hypothetical protein
MPLELDASNQAGANEADGQLEDWSEVEGAVTPTEPQPQQPAEAEPPIFVEAQKVRDKIAKLRIQEQKALEKVNHIRSQVNPLYEELGRIVAQSPDLQVPAPTVKVDGPATPLAETPSPPRDWRKAPIAVLKLTPATEKALVEVNETTTVGELYDYVEANGTAEGLDGITAKRAERIQQVLAEFIESQQ